MSEIVSRLREVCVDWNGENLSSGANPRIDIECGLLYDAAEHLEVLTEAVRKASQLASIASDWNLDEVEIDGMMVSIHELQSEFDSALPPPPNQHSEKVE